MKHLLPFLAGFVAFVVVSSVFYMGIMPYPTSSCVVPLDQMNVGAMLFGNLLMVGLAAYMVNLAGDYSLRNGAIHGAVAGLTANGLLNIFVYAFFTCDGGHIFPIAEVGMDIVANVIFMGIAGALIGMMYQRGAAKAA